LICAPDLVNGSFELFGGILNILNIFELVKKKRVMGVSVIPVIFFTLWGIWNLYYYPHLGQRFSFKGGIAVVIVNTVWVALAIYYNKKNKRLKERSA
jgi:ABC-type transport system involved in cytochrome c biogenesis permease subunit